jgi:hypothetical protein
MKNPAHNSVEINIGDVYRKVRDNYLLLSEQNHPDNPELNDTNQLLTEQISWLSAEQIDLLSDEQKRDFLNGILTHITVQFDRETSRHQLTVEFNQHFSRHFEVKSGADRSSTPADQSSRTGGDPVTSNNPTVDRGGHDLKKPWGSRIGSAAEFEHSVTVE